MAGYIVELYKNIISDEQYWIGQGIDDPDLKKKIYVAYGDFDRMAVTRTDAFFRMRDVSDVAKVWIGDRQKLLLYELSSDNELFYHVDVDNSGFYTGQENVQYWKCESLFIGLTILQFKESQQEIEEDISEYLSRCRENILKVVEQNSKEEIPIYCSVFGMLGVYGVAILWACDQYTEILKMINLIKGTDIHVKTDEVKNGSSFLSVFTVFAKNQLDEAIARKKINNVKGKGMLQLTMQTSLSQQLLDRLKREIPDVQEFHCVGEYDLILEAEARLLCDKFERHKIFDPGEEFYEKNILQTNLRLCDDMKEYSWYENAENGKKAEETQKQDSVHETAVREKYNVFRKLLFEVFPKTAGMVDSLDLLYADYHSKIASVSNKMWANDYGQQFLGLMDIMQKNLERLRKGSTQISSPALLEDFQDILNCFEYQTVHIAESNNLVIDTPKCHLRYTGQNNLSLYAYFGIVKKIIELVYSIQRNSRQSRIIPMISVDTVPIINSVLFMDYGEISEDRIIKLNLPMMALYDIPAYVPYLYHEVFHYVVPRNRLVRNWAKGKCLCFFAMKNLVQSLLQTTALNKDIEIVDGILNQVLIPYIYEVVDMEYKDEDVIKVLTLIEKMPSKSMVDAEVPGWMKYERHLMEWLQQTILNVESCVLEDNLVFLVLRYIYCKKDDIFKMADDWAEMRGFDNTIKGDVHKNIEGLMNDLLGVVDNISAEKKAEVLGDLLKRTGRSIEELVDEHFLIQLSSALSEAVCDIPMLEMCEMEVASYLLCYVKIQKDLLIPVTSEPQVQDCIRTGVAMDYVFGYREMSYVKARLKNCREDFICTYIGFYYSDHLAKSSRNKQNPFDTNGLKTYLANLKQEAQEWFDKITKWYNMYLAEYRIAGNLFASIVDESVVLLRKSKKNEQIFESLAVLKNDEYYRSVRDYGKGISEIVSRTDIFSYEEILYEIEERRRLFQDEIFKQNIEIIQHFQRQRDFSQIAQMRDDYFDGNGVYVEDIDKLRSYVDRESGMESAAGKSGHDVCSKIIFSGLTNTSYQYKRNQHEICYYTFHVDSVTMLFEVIGFVADEFERRTLLKYGVKRQTLWYRGQKSAEYKLLPSAMRKYKQYYSENNKRGMKELSLRSFQRSTYEQFKFRMDNASERVDKTGFTACDYLALMQHYGAPTIYMDWAENAMPALYFALEPYLDPKKTGERNNDDAVIYILNPNLYNESRARIMEIAVGSPDGSPQSGRALDDLMWKTSRDYTGSLPNLAVEYNKERYAMFLLGDLPDNISIPKLSGADITDLYSEKDKERLLYLPMAVYSSRSNVRIRAQSGMFMAFNIFSMPDINHEFNYMALKNIQDFYLKYFPESRPFMYEIIIQSDAKEKIANWLKAIGIVKDMIYPELENIGERIF